MESEETLYLKQLNFALHVVGHSLLSCNKPQSVL